MWVEELRRYPAKPAQDAARECFRNCKFPPTMPEYLTELRRLLPKLGHAPDCACSGLAMIEVNAQEDRWAPCRGRLVPVPELGSAPKELTAGQPLAGVAKVR